MKIKTYFLDLNSNPVNIITVEFVSRPVRKTWTLVLLIFEILQEGEQARKKYSLVPLTQLDSLLHFLGLEGPLSS